MKKINWTNFLSLAALPLLQLLLGAVLIFNPDGALAALFRVFGWLLVAVAAVLLLSMNSDRSWRPGKTVSAVLCGIGGLILVRDPLILAAGTGKFLGLLLIIRALAGMVQGGRTSGRPARHALGEVPELILGAFLLLSPMSPTRLIFGIIGAVLAVGAVIKLIALNRDPAASRQRDPKIIDADE